MVAYAQLISDVRTSIEANNPGEPIKFSELLESEAFVREALTTPQGHLLAALQRSKSVELSPYERARLVALYGDDLPKLPEIFSRLVGFEGVVIELMRYLQASQFSQELQRAMLVFRGPTGSGKSTFLDILLRNFQGFTWMLAECPIHESAMHLLSKEHQLALAESLGLTITPGTLCSVCQGKLLASDSDSVFNWKVRRVPLHHVVQNPHITLTGDKKVDLGLLVGLPDNTGVQCGGLIFGNCGIVIISGLDDKKTAENVRPALHATTYDRNALCPRLGAHATASALHIAVANAPLFEGDAAMAERMQEIKVPYNISSLKEAEALNATLPNRETLPLFVPHAARVAALMAVYTRLTTTEPPEAAEYRKARAWNMINPDERIMLYDGCILIRNGARFTPKYIELLAWLNDGFTQGISFRKLSHLFLEMVAELVEEGQELVMPYDVVTRLERLALTQTNLDKGVVKGASQVALVWYHRQLVEDLTRAAFPKQFGEIDRLAAAYLDHLDGVRTSSKVRVGESEEAADPAFLAKIEKAIGVATEADQTAFRSSLGSRRLGDIARNPEGSPEVSPVLLHAVERFLLNTLRENVRAVVCIEHPDDEQREILDQLCGTEQNPGGRLTAMGYPPAATRQILAYAKTHIKWEVVK